METGARYSLTIPCCVRGYHVYQRIWAPHIGEKATTVREPDNELHMVSNYVSFSNFVSMEGPGSISNCMSSVKNSYYFLGYA